MKTIRILVFILAVPMFCSLSAGQFPYAQKEGPLEKILRESTKGQKPFEHALSVIVDQRLGSIERLPTALKQYFKVEDVSDWVQVVLYEDGRGTEWVFAAGKRQTAPNHRSTNKFAVFLTKIEEMKAWTYYLTSERGKLDRVVFKKLDQRPDERDPSDRLYEQEFEYFKKLVQLWMRKLEEVAAITK